MNPAERAYLEQLRALTAQAFELRASPWLGEAVAAIVDAHQRRSLTELEAQQERTGRLIRLLRATDPDRLDGRSAAA